MTLYSPDGAPFGTFSATGVAFDEARTRLPNDLPVPVMQGDRAHFFTKVASSHESCSQCDIARTSVDGKYYYVLESSVSTASLVSAQSLAARVAAFFFLLNAFVSWFAATLISRRLVKNIRLAVCRVRQISDGGLKSTRVNLEDGTEISYLTREFDRLLDSLETSQQQVLQTHAMSSKVELAKVVAHNIKSPVVALEMTIPLLLGVPESIKKSLKRQLRK